MKSKAANIDPGKPGLYECHYLYTIGKERFLRYIVVLINTVNFSKAYELGLMQIEINHPYTRPELIKVSDNILNLITDPKEYITQE